MSDRGEAVSVRMVEGGQATVWTHRTNRVVISTPWAEVRIHAREAPDGPDTFVLRSTDGKTKTEAAFWVEQQAAEAVRRAPGLWAVEFSEHMNEGAAEDLDLSATRFTLLHRPGGSEAGERVVASDEPYARLFNMRTNGAHPQVAAHFVPARFWEGAAARLPERAAQDVQEPMAPDVLREAAAAEQAAAEEAPHGAAAAAVQEQAAPVRERPEESPLPSSGTTIQRWLYVFALKEDAYDAAKGPVRSAGWSAHFVGAWQADAGRRYHFAPYPQGGNDPQGQEAPVPAFVPEAQGAAAGRVLLNMDELGIGGVGAEDLYVWLSPFALPWARVDHLRRTVEQSNRDGTPLTPTRLGLGPATFTRMTQSSHASWDRAGGCVEWYVPDPLRVAEGRAEAAQEAQKRFDDWQEKARRAGLHSGLVGTPCYDAAHARTYLQQQLGAIEQGRPERRLRPRPRTAAQGRALAEQMRRGREQRAQQRARYDMSEAWKGFSPKAATGSERVPEHPPGEELLGQFLYGYRCQEAYLKERRRVAGRRFVRWMAWTAFLHVAADCFAVAEVEAPEGGPPSEEVLRAERRIFSLYWRMTRMGQGGGFLAALLRASGLVGHAGALAEEAYDRLLEPLDERRTLPWQEQLEGPAFTLLWNLAQKSSETAAQFVQAWSPVIASQTFAHEPAAANLIAAFAWKARHRNADGVYTVWDGGKEEWRFGSDVVVRRKRVSGIEFHATRRRGAYWRVNVHTQMEIDVGKVAGFVDDGVTGINVVLAGYAVVGHVREGALDWGDAIAVGQIVADGAGLVAERGGPLVPATAARVGKILAKAGPLLSVAEGAWGVAEALTDTDPRGLQQVRDPDGWGALGAAVGAAGGLMVTNAPTAASSAVGVALGLTAGGAVIVGLLLVGAGAGLMWWIETEDRRERKAADPLWQWLPRESLWGERPQAIVASPLEALFQLVRPGQDEGAAPPAVDFEAQTKGFLKTAYTFPTTVAVKENAFGNDVVEGLALRIAPEYLPAYGTLMVDASVQTTGLQAVPIRCAVHYVKAEGGYRYCVKGEGALLESGEAQTLAEQAARERWARAETAGRGPKRVLVVCVGSGWPVRQHSELEQLTAPASERELERRLGQMETWPERYKERYAGQVERLRVMEQQQERIREATEAGVDAGSVLGEAATPGLQSVLRGGRFRVTGYVYFKPLLPFNPTPTVPASLEQAKQDLVAFEQIGGVGGYTYPESNAQ